MFSWGILSSGQPDLVYKTKINVPKKGPPNRQTSSLWGQGPSLWVPGGGPDRFWSYGLWRGLWDLERGVRETRPAADTELTLHQACTLGCRPLLTFHTRQAQHPACRPHCGWQRPIQRSTVQGCPRLPGCSPGGPSTADGEAPSARQVCILSPSYVSADGPGRDPHCCPRAPCPTPWNEHWREAKTGTPPPLSPSFQGRPVGRAKSKASAGNRSTFKL